MIYRYKTIFLQFHSYHSLNKIILKKGGERISSLREDHKFSRFEIVDFAIVFNFRCKIKKKKKMLFFFETINDHCYLRKWTDKNNRKDEFISNVYRMIHPFDIR